MKTSELTKFLRKNGCKLLRHGSNHDIWHSTISNVVFPLPRHPNKEIPTGTVNKILMDAGLK